MLTKWTFWALCIAATFAAAVPGAASAQQVIRFGALYPLSGTLALLGEESFRGLELAVEERNSRGGLRKAKIELVKADAVDANQAVGEARRLISVDKVIAIFGSYASSISMAATQVAELADVPYFELGAISDPITDRKFKNIFRTNPTAKDFANTTVDAVADAIAPALKMDPKAIRIGIIHEDSLYGQTVAGFQKKRAQERGLNVVEVLPYSASTIDLAPVILRLRGSNVDVVLQASYQNDTVLFWRQMKDLSFTPKAVIGAGGGYSMMDTVKAVGAANIEGALNTDFTQFKTNAKAAPGIDEYVKRYAAKYGTAPRSGHSLANYMGAKVILDGLESATSMNPEGVRAAMMKIDIPLGSTVTGWGVKFGENGQNTRAKPFLMQWQGGELLTVFPKDAAVGAMKIGVGNK